MPAVNMDVQNPHQGPVRCVHHGGTGYQALLLCELCHSALPAGQLPNAGAHASSQEEAAGDPATITEALWTSVHAYQRCTPQQFAHTAHKRQKGMRIPCGHAWLGLLHGVPRRMFQNSTTGA